MSMRIGFFSSSLPEPHRKPGGVDVYVDRLATKLVQRGHQVRMFSYSPAPMGHQYEHCQLEPANYAESRIRRMTIVPARLNRLNTCGLDILHLHGDDWFYVRRQLPTVRTFYGSALYEARSATRLRRKVGQIATFGLEVMASRLATTTYGLIPGDGGAHRTSGYLAPAVEIPDDVRIARDDPPVVLFVGTWEGRKRGRLLFEAFQRVVLPRVPKAELVMVSDRCDTAPHVQLVIRPSDNELRELYRRAWIFCLPSSYEGFGIPYLEAMAQGTAVVATPNPGSQFVLQSGALAAVVPDDQLGERIAALLLDRDLRERQATAGRERVEDTFAWPDAIAAHERAYNNAIERWSGLALQ